jgi:hypothetical protein
VCLQTHSAEIAERWYKPPKPVLMRRQLLIGRHMKRRFLAGMISLIVSVFQSAAHPLDNWHVRYNGPGGGPFYTAITYGDGLFIIAGSAGALLTSADAQNWSTQVSGTTGFLWAAAHGNHTFAIVGAGGSIISSVDGTNWSQRSSGTTTDLHSVIFARGQFVAAGGNVLLTSSDGTTWTPQTVGGSFTGSSMVYGNGLFLLPGPRGTNFVSNNGTTWIARSSGTSNNLYTVGFGNGAFMEIDIQNRVLISTDGSNWTQQSTVTLLRPSQITYGSGCFVICGGGNTQYSEDTVNWKTPASGYLYVASSAVFAQATFVMVGGGTKVMQSDPVLMLEMPAVGTLRIAGRPGQMCFIESIDELASGSAWSPLTNFALPSSPYIWADTISPNSAQRFYRAALGP